MADFKILAADGYFEITDLVVARRVNLRNLWEAVVLNQPAEFADVLLVAGIEDADNEGAPIQVEGMKIVEYPENRLTDNRVMRIWIKPAAKRLAVRAAVLEHGQEEIVAEFERGR